MRSGFIRKMSRSPFARYYFKTISSATLLRGFRSFAVLARVYICSQQLPRCISFLPCFG